MRILRYLLTPLILLGLSAGISFYFMRDQLKTDALQPPNSHQQSYHFPAELSLKNKAGAELEVTLLARNHELVQFMRQSDQFNFLYPITELDAASQKAVLQYPDRGLIQPENFLKNQSISLQQVHSESTRVELENVGKAIRVLSAQRNAIEDRASTRGIQDEIDRLKLKQAQLSRTLSRLDANAESSSAKSSSRPSGSSAAAANTATTEVNSALVPDNLLKMLELKNELLAE